MTFNPLSIYVLVCGAMTVTIAYYAWRHRANVGARAFSAFMLSLSVYIIGYSLELASPGLAGMLFWNRVEYIGILSFPALYLVFAMQYTGREAWVTRRVILLLSVITGLLLFVKFTDEGTHLIYGAVSVDSGGVDPLLAFTHGPVYLLISAYNILLMTIGNVLFLAGWRHGSELYRRQTTIMLSAAAVLYAMYVLYLTGWEPFPALAHLDINPFMYTLWGLAIGWAIFRYRLFDLAPVARDALIEMLRDGVVVLDARFRIVDANPQTERIFGWRGIPLGEDAKTRMSGWIDPDAIAGLTAPVVKEVRQEKGGSAVDYEVTVSALRPGLRRGLGYLAVIHDISERREYERKLEELSLADELTGLNNRRGFKMLAGQMIPMARRLKMNAVVLYIDLDGLKIVNDSLGHSAGDRLLTDTADLLRSSFRASDIVARLGGDEFVVLAIESGEATSETMRARLEGQRMELNRRPGRASALAFSVGAARYRWEEPVEIESLLEAADRAMFEQKRAKKAGAAAPRALPVEVD